MENSMSWNETQKLINEALRTCSSAADVSFKADQVVQCLVDSRKVDASKIPALRLAVSRGLREHQRALNEHLIGWSDVMFVYEALVEDGHDI